ncbi:DNA-directed RNA polymerase subunit K [Candidatus Aenigmatarchaeota archaeon]
MFYYNELTRFEKTRIIAARALQISMGAPVLIKTGESDPRLISNHEFEKNVLPITVRRFLKKAEKGKK